MDALFLRFVEEIPFGISGRRDSEPSAVNRLGEKYDCCSATHLDFNDEQALGCLQQHESPRLLLKASKR